MAEAIWSKPLRTRLSGGISRKREAHVSRITNAYTKDFTATGYNRNTCATNRRCAEMKTKMNENGVIVNGWRSNACNSARKRYGAGNGGSINGTKKKCGGSNMKAPGRGGNANCLKLNVTSMNCAG